MKKCILIGAGEFDEESLNLADAFVVAVDGGYSHCLSLGIVPHLLIGDFDSYQGDLPHLEIISSSPIKDDTDMAMGIQEAINRGYTLFELYGACGGRFEHTLANIQLLYQLKRKGYYAKMIHKNQTIQVLVDESMTYPASASGYLSVFSLSDRSEGVTLKNLKYELKDAILYNDIPLGIDNEFIGKEAKVEVQHGALCCISTR